MKDSKSKSSNYANQTETNNQKSIKQMRDNQRYTLKPNQNKTKQQDLSEDQPDQPNQQSNQQTIQKAGRLGIQKYFGLYLNCNNHRYNKLLDTKIADRTNFFTDIQQYEQLKLLKSFNKDFNSVVDMLQGLRLLVISNLQMNQKHQKTFNYGKIQEFNIASESDVLSLMYIASKINQFELTKTSQNPQNENKFLKAIQKMQIMKQQIESQIDFLQDQTNFKRKIIQELQSGQKQIQDYILLIQNRNKKLEAKLNQGVDSSQQEDYQLKQNSEIKTNQQQQQQDQEDQEDENNQDYQKQYLQIMESYGLYDAQNQTILQSFPKNKTQALMLLNQIESQIQKLEMEKLVKGYSN